MSASSRAFVCECGDPRCAAQPRLTDAEYATIRKRGLKLVSAVHALEEVKVVDRGPGWVAVGRRRRVARPALPADGATSQHDQEACYCGVCATETIPSETGRCLWCGGRLGVSEEAA
jgi:hypothetical protein